MLKEFKDFLMKGNLLEIAVGLILALAFKAVVDSLVTDIITPSSPPSAASRTSSRLMLDIGDGADPLRRLPQHDLLVPDHRLRALPDREGRTTRMVEAAERKGQEDESAEPGEDVILPRDPRRPRSRS